MEKLNETINIIRFLTRAGVCNDMQNEILSYYNPMAKKIQKYERKITKYYDDYHERREKQKYYESLECILCERENFSRTPIIECASCERFTCCFHAGIHSPRGMTDIGGNKWFCDSCNDKKCIKCYEKVKYKNQNHFNKSKSIICDACYDPALDSDSD